MTNTMDTEDLKKAGKDLMEAAQGKTDDLHKTAQEEYAKIKEHFDTTSKEIETYVKKNPAKAALISAGIGAALAAAATLLLTGGKDKDKSE